MEEWKTYKLGEICSRLRSGKGINSDCIADKGTYPVIGGNGIRGYAETSNFSGECCVIGRQGAYCGNVRYFYGDSYVTEHAIVAVGNELVDTRFLSCLLSLMHLGNLSAQSAQPGISVQTLSKQKILLPPLGYQKKVSAIIKSLDDKIEVNRRINDNFSFWFFLYLAILLWQINDNLEQQAQALFKSWFVDFEPFKNGKFVDSELGMIPEGWCVVALTDIADYLNGLAMQKFRPNDGEHGIPVLKIKELGQGHCDDNSDLCSTSIKAEYIINDGDVIFSWSGTLLVDLWCGGRCGLNQHLFKVTSKNYPKWFYYLWTHHHLDKFVRIAKDKAVTMGHIKRGELDKSLVLIPNEKTMADANSLFSPLIEAIISCRIANRRIENLRDIILPKLMSGELIA